MSFELNYEDIVLYSCKIQRSGSIYNPIFVTSVEQTILPGNLRESKVRMEDVQVRHVAGI